VQVDQPSRCRAAISAHLLCTFPPDNARRPGQHTRTPIIGLSRLVSSRHPIVFCCHCTLHARTAPHSTPLPLSSVCTSATRQAPPSRQTRQYSAFRRVTIVQPQLQYTAHLLACSSSTTRTRTPPLPLLSAAVAKAAPEVSSSLIRAATYISTSTTLQ
jgi:hypothetical protein